MQGLQKIENKRDDVKMDEVVYGKLVHRKHDYGNCGGLLQFHPDDAWLSLMEAIVDKLVFVLRKG